VHYTTSCNTQFSAPEDGRDDRPKHFEPIGIIYKPLLLHLVGVYIIYVNDARSNRYHIGIVVLKQVTTTSCQYIPELITQSHSSL